MNIEWVHFDLFIVASACLMVIGYMVMVYLLQNKYESIADYQDILNSDIWWSVSRLRWTMLVNGQRRLRSLVIVSKAVSVLFITLE